MNLIRLYALMAMQICCVLIVQYFHFNTASLQTLSCLILYRGWFHGVWNIDFKCKHHNSLAWAGSTSVCNKCHVHTHWNKSLPLMLANSVVFIWAVRQEYRSKTFNIFSLGYYISEEISIIITYLFLKQFSLWLLLPLYLLYVVNIYFILSIFVRIVDN